MKTLILLSLLVSTPVLANGIAEEMDVSPIVIGGECSEKGVNRPIEIRQDSGKAVYLPSTVNWCLLPEVENPIFDTTRHGG